MKVINTYIVEIKINSKVTKQGRIYECHNDTYYIDSFVYTGENDWKEDVYVCDGVTEITKENGLKLIHP